MGGVARDNPWHDGGGALPAVVLLRILQASLASALAVAHGGATGGAGVVTHAAAAPLDPRRRLAELASVCRAWLDAVSSNDVARELCVKLHHLPEALPPDIWRGALAPQPRDRVSVRQRYGSLHRGTVLSVDAGAGGGPPTFMVQLDDGPVCDCDAAALQPTAPYSRPPKPPGSPARGPRPESPSCCSSVRRTR